MRTRILASILMLITLFVALASAQVGPSNDQNIVQNADNMAKVYGNNSTVNQTNAQNAAQMAQAGASGTSRQNIGQNANNTAEVSGNARVNQNTAQNATQMAQTGAIGPSSQNIGQNANSTAEVIGNAGANQNISQNANNTAQMAGSGAVNQNIVQNAYQNATWNSQNYWTMNEQTPALTSEQRTVLTSRTERFLTDYSSMRMYVIPIADFRTIYTERPADVFILDVSKSRVSAIETNFPGAVNIPIESLTARLNEIPMGKTVVVVSDNDIDSAVATTILRMYGYNTWLVQSGVCGWQPGGWLQQGVPGTTGFAGPTGVTGMTQVSGVASTTQSDGRMASTTGYAY